MVKTKRCMFILLTAMLILFSAIPAFAASKPTRNSLIQKIQNKGAGEIKKTYYSDFDGDGKKELFAVADGRYDEPSQIWFASSKEVKLLYDDMAVYYEYGNVGIAKISKKQKLFLAEVGGYGSGSASKGWYVKKGKAKTIKKVGSATKQLKKKEFTFTGHAFDSVRMTDGSTYGHTYKPYYAKWTGKKFKEYKGKYITKTQLKKYSGTKKVLNLIKKNGYTVMNIIRRGNGIININISKTDTSGDTRFDNVTLRIKKKKAVLVKAYAQGADFASVYSYGGTYLLSAF
ncbi:MAG: hypothetical protein IJI10_02770 [Eubacterium sp.]|nr:hypothetical protein [Eubacterium sp.]